MTQLEKTKKEATSVLINLCARCKEGFEHSCPIQEVNKRIEAINGIPVIVNNRLYHVVFS